MKTTDTEHLLGLKHAETLAEHLYDVGGASKEAAIEYMTTGVVTPKLDSTTKLLIDEGLGDGLDYLIKCFKEFQKGIEKIKTQGYESDI